ncbi:hypothetical protein SAMN05216413_0324 [Ruminococcaceae bacterium KH2T8]|nr:hypothetical protein SAMN05216413_0324 [Ruminococcaceae bacterium KH2T8]
MPEIKCPKCGNVFQVDESDYASIAGQIRDHEFQDELNRRIREIEEKKEQDLQIALIKKQQEQQDLLAQKDMKLKEAELLLTKMKSESESQINTLKAQIAAGDTARKLAVAEAQSKKDEEIAAKNSELIKLQGELQTKEAEMKLKETSLKDNFAQQLKLKDEQIEYYKDFKAKQSTKMVGESLEQHCQNAFNSIRMTAFPNAYFEKDNDAKTGSKGDFIFREASEDGTEFISIMFEMKNEMDTTATKHKNEDFFKELDKDRNEKGCEYAVLVSLLESDNELYNNGIVDVSYRYEKMYVIRPQFFIPMITLLRNAALNSLQYQRELAVVRNQQLDIVNFESQMNEFKDSFGRNYRIASDKFKKAIEEIDKTIDHLIKTKEALLSSDNNLRIANNKAEDLTIKKLTKNSPSVRAMFDEINKEDKDS